MKPHLVNRISKTNSITKIMHIYVHSSDIWNHSIPIDIAFLCDTLLAT